MLTSLKRFFRRWGNKFFALLFIGLGLAAYLGFYFGAEILSGWTYFRSDPMTLWSFAITLVCYGFLLFTNIRNDNRAYQGIFIYVSLLILDSIFNLIDMFRFNYIRLAEDPLQITFFIIYATSFLALIIVGIFFYVRLMGYMTGRNGDFTKLWIIAWVFLGVVALELTIYTVLLGIAGSLSNPMGALLRLALPVSELLIGFGVIFTLRRLRRL